jgi:perosamine synthetase
MDCKKKREVGNKYFKKLNNLKNILLQKKITKYAKNIYWVFGLVLKNTSKYSRDEIMRKLLKMKIETRPFFLPMHKQTIFKKMNLFKNIKLPNAEFISKNGFYIPSGIGIKDKEINFVINNLKKILH